MKELEFNVGNLIIDPEKLVFLGRESYNAAHKFIVGAENYSLMIYVAPELDHHSVWRKFKPSEKIVGGGSIFVNRKNSLVLNDYSGCYGSISRFAANRFGKLLLPVLEEYDFDITTLSINPTKSLLNDFWL